MQNYLYSKNGITLISLIVTVVVTLIIAGITISSFMYNGGATKNAQKQLDAAKEATNIKVINESLAELYIQHKGKLSFSDLPDTIIGSNNVRYAVDFHRFTIGGFTVDELGIRDKVDLRNKFYCLGLERTKTYYLVDNDEGLITYYKNDKKIRDYTFDYSENQTEYTDESYNVTFNFINEVLIVSSDEGEMIYAFTSNSGLQGLAGRTYKGRSNDFCSFSGSYVTISTGEGMIEGSYAAYKPSTSSSSSDVYIIYKANSQDEDNYVFLKGREEFSTASLERIFTLDDRDYVYSTSKK